ncbi:MAG: hypothetical protein Q8K00_06510 [Syntrophales bacterium]|nr:hypothetical protein [Syntrophales bacterium]
MNQIINESEQLVYDICKKSFLSLWSYANPLGKNSKELCDTLIVCDPDIIIISVKYIRITDSEDISTNWQRWRKRAIDDSVKQIYGAERWIESASHVIRSDASIGIRLPEKQNRRIHRVAIALGDQGKAPIAFGDFGKGFVHVFDKVSLNIVMRELDTIEDFVEYLTAKERLYLSGKRTLFHGGEEDLLALYLQEGRQFPDKFDLFVVDDTLWAGFQKSGAYRAKREADEISYAWDRLIEILCKDILHGNLEFGPGLNESEIAVRIMAREDRFGRRVLGKSFMEFYELARLKKVRSRMALGTSNTTYVFLCMTHGADRTYRKAELGARCLVARGLNKDRDTVIGLATERYEEGKGFSFDLLYLNITKWTDKLQEQIEYAQKEFGYFANPQSMKIHEDEYPQEGKNEI